MWLLFAEGRGYGFGNVCGTVQALLLPRRLDNFHARILVLDSFNIIDE